MPPPLCPCARLTPRVAVVGLVLAALLVNVGCFLGATVGAATALQSGGGGSAPAPARENQPPAATNIQVTATTIKNFTSLSGDVTVKFSLQDVESEAVTLSIQYSDNSDGKIENGAWVDLLQTGGESIAGKSWATTPPPGTPYTFIWNSGEQLAKQQKKNLYVRVLPYDAKQKTGVGVVSVPFNIDNNDIPVVKVTTPSGAVIKGVVDVAYQIADPNSDAVNVVTQYSTDGGRDFANATAASGSEGVANLTSSPAGEAHVFKWDTLADLSRVTSDEVQVRITPSDIKQGVSGTTESFTVANNDAPALSALAVQGITNPATDKVSGDVPVTFVLTDSHSDPIAIAVEYSTGGDTWRVATPRIGTKITGLSSSPDDPATPAVEGAGASFVWDTVTDLQESYQKTVSLRVTPRDARDGGATVAYPSAFIVDNNSPPEAALLASYAGVSRRGDVFITYKLSDKHSDLADVAIEFSTDGGGTFTAALEDSGSSLSQGVSKRTTSPTGVQSLFVWDSAGQIAGVAPAVTVRITPKDTTDNSLGVPVTTDAFTVDNTNPPVVTVATPSASSGGQTPVAYFLTDTESNAASITVEFSLNAGATYAAASRGAGGDGTQNLSTSSTGVSHVFVWNSLNDVGVTPSSQVRLRFTPTDTLTGASVITPVFTVDNSALAAGDAPPIITIANVRYSIDGGATYLPVEGATASKWVKVAYNLSDNGGDPDVFDDGDPASLTVEYSKDFGSTFSAATEILPAPSVTGLAPSSGLNNAAAAVTISGGAFAGATAAALDDPAATALTGLVVVDPRTITASVPAGVAAGVYNVKVTTARGTNGVSFPGFTAISSTETAPVVTDVTPAAGQNSVETSVTVVGKNFTGATAAALDDGAATPLTGLAVASDGALTAKVPAGVAIGAYNVKVTNAAGTNAASSRKFSVTSGTFTPVVERVVPAIAGRLAATAVAIHGAGFTGATAVTLGDAAGTALTSLTALSDTEIRASVPAGVAAGNWQVKVTGAGGLTNAASGVALTVSDSDGTLDLVTSPYPGTAHGFLWDSQADVGPNFVPGVVLRFTAKDKNGTGIAATTAAFPVDNNVAPALAIDPVSGTKSLDISFTYLLTDPESNLVSLTPQYSIDDGATWKAATTKTGAPNGTTAITSAPAPGVSRAWVWASATDIGAKAYPAARVRLTPADAVKAGQAQTSNSFAVDNNTAPIVSLISTPSGVQRGDVTIQYELKDSASDPASIVIEYSIDGGATWLAATLTSGATTNLATSPTGVLQSLVWNSAANLGATATAQAKFRVTPSDAQKTGVPVATNNFTIYNATPPSVSVQTPQGVQNNAEGTVDILYTLSDAESNTASIFVEFSVNGGVNWSPASQAPGGDGTTGLVPGNRLYKWNRLDAGPTPTNNARVRITPTDELPGATAGAAGSTGDFSVDNQGNFNFPPSVANLSTPSGLQSDDIAFTYDISDPDTLDNQ
ncbi:MAG: hypothetical protein HY719_09320, partial [Planctomycetes bacterium]|nr:hypothetical protein [Planctomycetota bacterium]